MSYVYICHMYIVISLEDNLMAMLGLHSDQSIAIRTQLLVIAHTSCKILCV